MKRTIGALCALALFAAVPASAAPVQQERRTPNLNALTPEPLPNFDRSLRLYDDGQKTGAGPRHAEPRFLWNTRDEVARARPFSTLPVALAANAQLKGLAQSYGLSEVRTLGLSFASTTSNELGQQFVRYEQRIGGIEVFRSGATALLDREHQVVALSSNLAPQAFGVRSFDADLFELSARDAIAIGYADMTGQPLDAGLFVGAPTKGDYLRFSSSSLLAPSKAFLSTPARAKRVLFPTEHGLVPAWYVELQVQRPGSVSADGYAYVVAAHGREGKVAEGGLLFRNHLVADADLVIRAWADTTPPYTPYDGPVGPDATPYPHAALDVNAPYHPYVASNLVTLPDSKTSAARDPWLLESDTESLGNHAFAYADLVAPDGFNTGDVLGEMNLPFGFDYTYDLNQNPNATPDQIQAAVAQLFYTNQWMHDFFYPAGFDEVSGNAQWDNFGRGGLDQDPVHAQGQDHSGTDNANMLTPADGSSPRMQMYVFNAIGPYTIEFLAPAGFDVTTNVTSAGPQAYDVTLDVAIGAPAADCTMSNLSEVDGKAVVVPWETATCGPLDLFAGVAASGGAMVILNYDEPAAPDLAPFVTGTEDMSPIPIIITSYNGAAALEAAVSTGTVTVHVEREAAINLDGTIDNAIIAHEWGHYLTNRLIGNGSGLSSNQARSMGEGWSDFVSLLMSTRPEDAAKEHNVNWTGAFPAATYAPRGFVNELADYFGIRRIPYSVDRTKNALSFRHIDNSQPLPFDEAPMLDFGNANSQFHNSGEIWATMLWETYVSLLRAHPFEEAQTRMKNYLVAGLKITPVQPTYTEARDALLAAAFAHDPADFERMAAAFASRGAGVLAVAPPRESTTHEGVVESDSVGALPKVVSATLTDTSSGAYCDRDGVLDDGEDGTLTIRVTNVGWTELQAGELTVTSTSPGVTVSGDPRAVPGIVPFGEVEIEVPVSLGTSGASPATLSFEVTVTAPNEAETVPAQTLTLSANYDVVSSTTETVEAPLAELPWTQVFDPTLAAVSFTQESFASSLRFYGENPGTYADYSLVSPVLEVGEDPLVITFEQFFQFEAGGYDGGVIELSADGGNTWEDIGSAITAGPAYNGVIDDCCDNPLSGRDGFINNHAGWPLPAVTTVNLGTSYAGQSVQIRFRIGSDVLFGDTGWYIDNVAFSGITNAPFIEQVTDDGVCENRPPVADAGADFSVDELTEGTLAGSATDPDGLDDVTYAWSQVDGPEITLDAPNAATTTFTAPEVPENTPATFKLTVNDGEFTAEDTVVVTINHVNKAPVADAGPDFAVEERAPYTLLGTGTDVDGDALTFTWSQVSGPEILATDSEGAALTFVAPEVAADATAVLRLTVSDGALTATDDVTVTIVHVNLPPTVDAGEAFDVPENSVGTLSGTAVDPDGDAVSVLWSQVDGPEVSIVDPDQLEATFVAPEVAANTTATFKLTATDGALEAEGTVVVTIVQVNKAPIADAGEDRAVGTGSEVTLQGSGTDPDGDTLTFAWTQTGGEAVTLNDADTATPTFTAPEVTEPTDLTFELVVNDGALSSEPSAVTIQVLPNNAPVVTVVGDAEQSAEESTELTLAVEASDEDGDAVTVTWTQVSGPEAVLSATEGLEITVTLPEVDEATEIVLEAVGSDGSVESAPATFTITVTDIDEGEEPGDGSPTVSILNLAPVPSGGSARLIARAEDPAGGTLTYTWEQTSGPEAEIRPEGELLWVTVPEVDENTALEFKVTVTSSESGLSSSATGTINVVTTSGGGCGGCSSGGAGAVLPAGLAFLAFALRRRRMKA